MTHGNADINELTAYLKERVGGTLDGTIAGNRHHCSNLLKKLRKDYPGKDAVAGVKLLIDAAQSHDRHRAKGKGFWYYYYATQELIELARARAKQRPDPKMDELPFLHYLFCFRLIL